MVKAHNRFISFSKHNTHDLRDPYFPKGVLNTNEHCKCEWKKQNNIALFQPPPHAGTSFFAWFRIEASAKRE